MVRTSRLPVRLRSPQILDTWAQAGYPEINDWLLVLHESPDCQGIVVTPAMLFQQLARALEPKGMSLRQYRRLYQQHVPPRDDADLESPETIAEFLATVDQAYESLLDRAGQRRATGEAMRPTPLPRDGNQAYPLPLVDHEERVERILRAASELAEIMDQADPIITHYERAFDTDCPVAILGAGCFQMGGRYTFHRKFREEFDRLLGHERFFAVFLGDEIDGFWPWFHNVKSVVEQPISPRVQVLLFESYLERLAPKVLCGMWSQHGSQWFEARTGDNPLKKMYMKYDIPYFDGKAYLTLHVGSQTYHFGMSHEFPGSSLHNPTHPHIRALRTDFPSADVIMMADKHQYAQMERQIYQYEAEAGLRASPYVQLLQVGTAKIGPDPYSIRGWSRGQGDWPIIVLYPDRHLVKVTRHWEDAVQWLG